MKARRLTYIHICGYRVGISELLESFLLFSMAAHLLVRDLSSPIKSAPLPEPLQSKLDDGSCHPTLRLGIASKHPSEQTSLGMAKLLVKQLALP